jgi:hypothetical protein
MWKPRMLDSFHFLWIGFSKKIHFHGFDCHCHFCKMKKRWGILYLSWLKLPLCWFKWIWFYHPLHSCCHKLQLSLWLKFPREPCISMSMLTFCIEDHIVHLIHYHYLLFGPRNHVSPRNWVHLTRKTMVSWELRLPKHGSLRQMDHLPQGYIMGKPWLPRANG